MNRLMLTRYTYKLLDLYDKRNILQTDERECIIDHSKATLHDAIKHNAEPPRN